MHPRLEKAIARMANVKREERMDEQDGISQKEKRQVMGDDRASTYYQQAIADAGVELGRFKHLRNASVTGATVQVPKLPSSSPWSSDPVPNEEPLGFSVDQLEPTGTNAEIEQSVQPRLPCAAESPPTLSARDELPSVETRVGGSNSGLRRL
jgi:hypothetical protein